MRFRSIGAVGTLAISRSPTHGRSVPDRPGVGSRGRRPSSRSTPEAPGPGAEEISCPFLLRRERQRLSPDPRGHGGRHGARRDLRGRERTRPAGGRHDRLREDVLPFHFQVVSTAHHAWGAIQDPEGEFSPPSFEFDQDYAGLQALIEEARSGLAALDRADVEALEEGNLVFKLGKNEIPFTAKNFLLSFSLPNFYFHATTTYDILRMAGAPVGKMAFLGPMKAGV